MACEHSDNKSFYTIVVICLLTGARRNEIVGLERPEIDFKRKAIVLEDTKNGERRVIFLGSFAWSVLMQHLNKLSSKSHLIFPSPSNSNKPIDIQTAWKTAVKRAKIENFCFHDLRHCAASYLAMNRATFAEISEILRYAHLTERHTAKVIESMNKKILAKKILQTKE